MRASATTGPSWSSGIVRLAASRSISLRVRRWGEDPPRFVLIHGFGDGAFVWGHIAHRFVPHGAVMALDLRGHGESEHDPERRYSMADHVADVTAALAAFCPEPVELVGHSLGAEIAMHLAIRQPERVRRVVLVDGGPELDPRAMAHMHSEFLRQPWQYRTFDEFLRHLEMKLPLASPAVLSALAPHAVREEPDGTWRLRCDRALGEGPERAQDESLWSVFRSIECPVVVIRGAGSAMLQRATAARMVREHRRCTLEIVPLAGHAVPLDNPSGLVAALDRCVFTPSLRRMNGS
jgi:pimeloyl-ACP methyl ester carboxylesterase